MSRAEDFDAPRSRSFPFWVPLISLPIAFLLASISAGIAAAMEGQRGTSVVLNAPVLATDEIGLWVVFFVALWFASRRYGTGSIRSDYRLRVRPWPDLPIGLTIGAICQILVIPALYFPFEIGNPNFAKSLSQPAQTLVGAGRSGGEILVFFVIVVGAPVMEELFFRGLVLRSLEQSFPKMRSWLRSLTIASISGAFFALAHFEPLQFLGLWVVGIVLSLETLKLTRLGMSIFTHMGFNLVAFVALVAFPHLP